MTPRNEQFNRKCCQATVLTLQGQIQGQLAATLHGSGSLLLRHYFVIYVHIASWFLQQFAESVLEPSPLKNPVIDASKGSEAVVQPAAVWELQHVLQSLAASKQQEQDIRYVLATALLDGATSCSHQKAGARLQIRNTQLAATMPVVTHPCCQQTQGKRHQICVHVNVAHYCWACCSKALQPASSRSKKTGMYPLACCY